MSVMDAVVHGARSSLQSPPETMHSARANWRSTIAAICAPLAIVAVTVSATATRPTTTTHSIEA